MENLITNELTFNDRCFYFLYKSKVDWFVRLFIFSIDLIGMTIVLVCILLVEVSLAKIKKKSEAKTVTDSTLHRPL